MVGLVKSRDAWAKKFENGEGLTSPLLERYRKERGSEHWRSTKILEEILEYVLYLERNQRSVETRTAERRQGGCITNGGHCMNHQSADLADFATAMNKEMFRFIEWNQANGSDLTEQVYRLDEWMDSFLKFSSFGFNGEGAT